MRETLKTSQLREATCDHGSLPQLPVGCGEAQYDFAWTLGPASGKSPGVRAIGGHGCWLSHGFFVEWGVRLIFRCFPFSIVSMSFLLTPGLLDFF